MRRPSRRLAAIVAWISRLRDFGLEQPVRIGLAGPTNLATLLRYARRCGVRARTIDGRQEARLTLRGVASGRSIEQPVVVCDIGGGSTELIAGNGSDVTFATSFLHIGVGVQM